MDKLPPSLIPNEKNVHRLNEQLDAGELLIKRRLEDSQTAAKSLRNAIDDWSDTNFMILSTSFDGNELIEEFNNVAQFQKSSTATWSGDQRILLREVAENLKLLRKILFLLDTSEINDIERNLPAKKVISVQNRDSVFIVHGHDNATKEMVARFILQTGLKPIILHEQPNQGKTIIEKFEACSNVAFALVLLSPDDIGYPATSPDQTKYRARQNVIFELGFFVGRIGRERVCALYKGNIEIPSDYNGVVYIPIDEAGAWKMAVAKDMKSIGIEIDLNRTL